MSENLLAQFELLLDAGKIEEAKAMLETLATRELSEAEQAESKLLLARLYVKLTNAVNQAYLDTLKDAIDQLKELNAREREFIEKMKLAKTRVELAK
jgi:hypothetical protein